MRQALLKTRSVGQELPPHVIRRMQKDLTDEQYYRVRAMQSFQLFDELMFLSATYGDTYPDIAKRHKQDLLKSYDQFREVALSCQELKA